MPATQQQKGELFFWAWQQQPRLGHPAWETRGCEGVCRRTNRRSIITPEEFRGSACVLERAFREEHGECLSTGKSLNITTASHQISDAPWEQPSCKPGAREPRDVPPETRWDMNLPGSYVLPRAAACANKYLVRSGTRAALPYNPFGWLFPRFLSYSFPCCKSTCPFEQMRQGGSYCCMVRVLARVKSGVQHMPKG